MLVGNAWVRVNEFQKNVHDIKLIFLKLWIFANFNTVFPVLVLVFVFEEFSEEVLHGHCFVHQLYVEG
jgi:hypothetical protein